MMTEAVINLCDNVGLTLLRNNFVVEYVELDYGKMILDTLYSMLRDKNLDRMTVNLSGILSHKVYRNSFFFDRFSKLNPEMYCLFSENTVEKMAHAAKVMDVRDLVFTDRLSCCRSFGADGCYVDYANSAFNVYAIQGGSLLEYSCCTGNMLKDTVQRVRRTAGIEGVVNMTTLLETELLGSAFKNVFSVTDVRILRALTQTALILKARSSGFTYDDYMRADGGREAVAQAAAQSAPRSDERTSAGDSGGGQLEKTRKFVKKEKQSSDRYRMVKFLAIPLFIFVIAATVFLVWWLFSAKYEYAELRSAYSLLHRELESVKTRCTLVQTADGGGSMNAYDFFSEIESILGEYGSDKAAIEGLQVQDGQLSLTVNFMDKDARNGIIGRLQAMDGYLPEEGGAADKEWRSETVVFEI